MPKKPTTKSTQVPATQLATSATLATPQPVAPQALTPTVQAPPAQAAAYCGEEQPCPPQGPLAVQLYRQTPDPTQDPFTAYYLMVRSASDFLSYNNFEVFLKGVLGTQANYPELAQLPPYEKLAYIASLFVACHGEWVKTCFQHGVAVNGQATPAPGGTLPPFDMAEANRIFAPYTLDINKLAAQAALLFDKPVPGGSLSHDAYTIVQQTIVNNPQVPYLSRQEIEAGDFDGFVEYKLDNPCMAELIWNYWQEEGMLVQGINAITLRFQNRLYPGGDKLARCNISHLRPLTNLIWSYVQHEPDRLSLARRAYEYDHHYGFTLHGKAIPEPRTADSRTKFLEAFHNLLFQCVKFYNEDDDTTRIADGFPVLNSLKEVHILLTEGGHNQYGDLSWTARMEMLMMEWLLARPEMREFLGGRPMVAYSEPWMDRVDTMKTLQGWTRTNVMHFRDLGVFGEQILLSVRFGNWNTVVQPQQAANWARYWRAEIQGYVHAYRAVTGVDVRTGPIDATPPSVHLRNRLASQARRR